MPYSYEEIKNARFVTKSKLETKKISRVITLPTPQSAIGGSRTITRADISDLVMIGGRGLQSNAAGVLSVDESELELTLFGDVDQDDSIADNDFLKWDSGDGEWKYNSILGTANEIDVIESVNDTTLRIPDSLVLRTSLIMAAFNFIVDDALLIFGNDQDFSFLYDNASGKLLLTDISQGNTFLSVEDLGTTAQFEFFGSLEVSDTVKAAVVAFDTTATETLLEGEMSWNALDKTVNIKTDTETIIQVGQENIIRGINKTGGTLLNGQVVYIIGADSDRPSFALAQADTVETARTTIGIITSDILDDAQGYATTFGLVRELDTSACMAGNEIYLSETNAGEFTDTRPTTPNFVISLGYVTTVHATEGTVFFNVRPAQQHGFFNGVTVEKFSFTVDATGGVITGSLERSGGGDLTLIFSDGLETLDTTPAITVTLTAAGSDPVPLANYIYIPQSTKVLTNSTSGFPTDAAHIKIAYVLVQTAATVEAKGALINQNHNDGTSDSLAQGHLSHLGSRIRHSGAIYDAGVDGNGVDDYLTLTASTSYLKMTGGVIWQMHRHIVPAFDQSIGDIVHIVNDSVTAYLESTNLFNDITADSNGVTIGNNRYFNLVIWGVGSKTGEYEAVMCNLPSGNYTLLSSALVDSAGYDNFNIPREFNIDSSTGFLICRLTIQMGATWSYEATTDLRGTTPQTARGGGGFTAITSFADNVFDVHNVSDPTKTMVFDVSGVTTGQTRTVSIPDKNVTIVDDHLDLSNIGTNAHSVIDTHIADGTIHFLLLDEDDMVSDDATKAASQQSIVAYVATEIAAAGVGSDDLGNHTATESLKMAGFAIENTSSLAIVGASSATEQTAILVSDDGEPLLTVKYDDQKYGTAGTDVYFTNEQGNVNQRIVLTDGSDKGFEWRMSSDQFDLSDVLTMSLWSIGTPILTVYGGLVATGTVAFSDNVTIAKTGGTVLLNIDDADTTRNITGITLKRNSVETWFAGMNTNADNRLILARYNNTTNWVWVSTAGLLNADGGISSTTGVFSSDVSADHYNNSSSIPLYSNFRNNSGFTFNSNDDYIETPDTADTHSCLIYPDLAETTQTVSARYYIEVDRGGTDTSCKFTMTLQYNADGGGWTNQDITSTTVTDSGSNPETATGTLILGVSAYSSIRNYRLLVVKEITAGDGTAFMRVYSVSQQW